jgi:hypothetical protein
LNCELTNLRYNKQGAEGRVEWFEALDQEFFRELKVHLRIVFLRHFVFYSLKNVQRDLLLHQIYGWTIWVQACHCAEGNGQEHPPTQTDDWSGVASFRSSAESGMDPLHDSWSGTSYFTIPKTSLVEPMKGFGGTGYLNLSV